MPSPNNQTDKVLQSLDGMDKLQAPDFFYTRLQARMEKELLNEPATFLLLRPAFLSSCLALALAFNIITLLNNTKDTAAQNNGAAGIESFAREYNMNTATQLYE